MPEQKNFHQNLEVFMFKSAKISTNQPMGGGTGGSPNFCQPMGGGTGGDPDFCQPMGGGTGGSPAYCQPMGGGTGGSH
jgi:hypothetical protein